MSLLATTVSTATAQDTGEMPALEGDAFDAGAPGIEMGGGDYFSQQLGTLLRLRYNTESYGQDRRGNLDIGTMQITNFEDAITFFDGQATLSDVNGVGYNLGVGFRRLGWTPFALEPERITGLSLWTDGTSTESGNFFPQVGVSFESLGEMWDLRVNGYVPIGQESQIGTFSPTGVVSFNQNFLVLESIADRNTSFDVAEAEIARRIMPDRDAWAFAGPYVLANSDQDAAGYRVGLRGYAYPDLLVQVAISDDDIFHTNAAFSMTWFVGRTRTDYQPACGLPDRMREPVMRNDYVALERTTEFGGEPLNDTNGDPLRFVHVASAAAAGGNGTFENPLNNVGNVEGNSQDSDIVLMWSGSTFSSQNTLVLQDNQRLLGEGNDEFFTVTTQQQGVVVIPETSPGARAGARPEIIGAQGLGAVQLADATIAQEVANFNIDGTGSTAGAEGIFSPAAGAGNPNIHDLDFRDVLGTGIQITPFTRTDTTNPMLMTVAGSVTIDDIEFDDMLGVEIDINSFTMTDITNPNVTLQETIAISDVDSQNGAAEGLLLQNTHDNRTATISNYLNGSAGTAGSGGGNLTTGVLAFRSTGADTFEGNVTLTNIDIFANTGFALHFEDIDDAAAVTITNNNGLTYNGLAGTAGGMRFDGFNGMLTGNSSMLSNGTLAGVSVIGTSDGTINLTSTVTFDSIDATVIDVGPNLADSFTGSLTVSGAITAHDTGRLVSIQRLGDSTAAVTLTGAMTDVANAASQGIFVGNNVDGTVLFSGILMVDTTNNNAIELDNNADADISFGGRLELVADGTGIGFLANNGGTLTVSNTGNTIATSGNAGVRIVDLAISNAGANFSEVNVTTSSTNGIFLMDNTGGPIGIGDPTAAMAGDSGTITGTTGTAVVIDNSANVTVSALIVNAAAGQSGVSVNKTTAGTQTVNLNDLEINDGAVGVNVTGNGTGTLTMSMNDTSILDSTVTGYSVDNIDAGTTAIVNSTIDGNNVNGTAQGVLIKGSNNTVTFDATTTIREFGGTDFEVDGDTNSTGNVTMNGDIVNSSTVNPGDTTGRSVHIHDIDGGAINFTANSSINDDNEGMLVENNSGGTVSFLGTNTFTMSGANDAVTLTNNDVGGTNTSMTIAGLNITTTAGSTARGLVATGGGTLTVSGTTNIIDTEDGSGLVLDGMTIGSVDFQRVTVDGVTGPTNAILLQNLTGGQVEIGTVGGAQNSGGVLRSTGDAIAVTNAQNVALRDLQVLNAGGRGIAISHENAATTAMDVTVDGLNLDASTGNGAEVTADNGGNTFILRFINSDLEENFVANVTGAGLFQMRVEDTTINVGGTTDAFATTIGGGATNVDLILRDVDFVAADASASTITTSGATAKTLDLLVDGSSTFTNGSATNPAAEYIASGNVTYNATIQSNTFDNSDAAGSDFTMTATGAQARIRLNLGGDTAADFNTAASNNEFNLVEEAGADFDVFELTATFANSRNNNTVAPQSPAGVANPGAFDNTNIAPTVPVIP